MPGPNGQFNGAGSGKVCFIIFTVKQMFTNVWRAVP